VEVELKRESASLASKRPQVFVPSDTHTKKREIKGSESCEIFSLF
jgi:hypothetical protein